MIPFLHSIAKAYITRYPDLSEICFLFPNKRSGAFFLNYLKGELRNHAILSPEVQTISEFAENLSGKVIASRIDLLFLLYESYKELLGSPGDSEDDLSFDSFIMWGETVLSDFNEVDQYLVDTEEIFKNVKDFREISSTFLTEEQKKVMAEYFGHNDYGDTGHFWKNFDNEEEGNSEIKKKFLHLWRILSPLYNLFKNKLYERGLTTTGGAYREALQHLKEKGKRALPYKKIVAIGFNALSTAEFSIFSVLKEMEDSREYDKYIDFFWDATGPVLSGERNSASKFVKANINSFPCPAWALPYLRLSDTDEMPALMRVVASPSNSAQTKITGLLLDEMRGKIKSDSFREAKVSVVLADESLLLPMLYSLPGGMGDVNLTMGYPMRQTSVATFVTLYRRLLNGLRLTNGEKTVYFLDLKNFLGHPLTHTLVSSKTIEKILKYVYESHRITVGVNELRPFSEEIAEIINGLDKGDDVLRAIDYLDKLLDTIAKKLPSSDEALTKSRLEIAHINKYRDNLHRIKDIVAGYEAPLTTRSLFRLIDRLIAGETVGFEGEPLTGLQVMGLLETRSLDFEHLFILSVNERILPRKARTRSFIPDSLRHAFGMPPSNYAEEIFAYYFYRMISRAKSVTMIYDARTGGLRSGESSRYIRQLKYLFKDSGIKEEDWRFILSGKGRKDVRVFKTEEIKQLLEEFLKEGGRNLSASSLETYRKCQVRFFYQCVLDLNADPEPSEFIDAIAAGNILHDAMLNIYLPVENQKKLLSPPVTITAEAIDSKLKDDAAIDRLVNRSINKVHYHLKGEDLDTPLRPTSEMVAHHIKEQVKNVLRHDRELTPFKIYGLELSDKFKIELTSGKRVNFKFAIDRLDWVARNGEESLRIVDYKTGSLKLRLESFEEIFDGDYRGEQVFQLFTYAWLLGFVPEKLPAERLLLEIYDVPGIHKGEINLPVIVEDIDKEELAGSEKPKSKSKKEEGKEVTDYNEYSEAFSKGMMAMLEEIFSDNDFVGCDESRCVGCPFTVLCGR